MTTTPTPAPQQHKTTKTSKNSKIAPAMNKDTVSSTIADIIKAYKAKDLFSVENVMEALYRNEDVGIKDVIEAFHQRLSHDYPNLSFEEFVNDIHEWIEK